MGQVHPCPYFEPQLLFYPTFQGLQFCPIFLKTNPPFALTFKAVSWVPQFWVKKYKYKQKIFFSICIQNYGHIFRTVFLSYSLKINILMGTISMCPCTCLFENNLICIKNKFSKIWLNLEISVDIIACWGRNFEPKLTTLNLDMRLCPNLRLKVNLFQDGDNSRLLEYQSPPLNKQQQYNNSEQSNSWKHQYFIHFVALLCMHTKQNELHWP